ncbi:HIT-like domain-containing protein [Limtongia smithiae]|uniref:HIT-like domain-containing protein n=1 Tax=Limtongia smithiae TaxID=1125753 RepID=UPI0034CF2397
MSNAMPAEDISHALALRRFELGEVLQCNTKTKAITLQGRIDGQDAIVLAEKTVFLPGDADGLAKRVGSMTVLGHNDVYSWFTAGADIIESDEDAITPAYKMSLIWPATEIHIRKYRSQQQRMVSETPEMYTKFVVPYIEEMRGSRLNWVYNILSHEAEEERIVYEDKDPENGFILLPDLKWDGTSIEALYLVALVNRRDIASIRDLRKEHISYLQQLRSKIMQATSNMYNVKPEHLQLYMHYPPSYYHMHIHVTAMGYGTEVGRVMLLEDVIARLEEMCADGYASSTLTYSIGENSQLWTALSSGSSESGSSV